MTPIKNVTFEALDNIANEIFEKSKSKKEYPTMDYVRKKIADYLITDGNKKFVQTYNELAVTKDYQKAINTFKI